MSELLDRVRLNNLVNGNGMADNFKNNSLFFYDKYSKSDDQVTSIQVGDMTMGSFYFLHYKDDSNWNKFSPIFTVDFKKFGNMIVVLAINFNFIPIEIRISIFDKFMISKDFDDDRDLSVDYKGVYDELRKYGFEYSIIEYNINQIVSVHRINMELVPKFLYSQHPINKYDPIKLYSICKAKISNRDKRHNEILSTTMKDLYEASDDILNDYEILKGHIQRLQKSVEKYG